MYEQIVLATSNTWTQTLDLDPKNLYPEKSIPWKTWIMKDARNGWVQKED